MKFIYYNKSIANGLLQKKEQKKIAHIGLNWPQASIISTPLSKQAREKERLLWVVIMAKNYHN